MTLRDLEELGAQIFDAMALTARKYGVSPPAVNALATIEGAGGSLAAGEISRRMIVTTGSMTSLLDTLERKGLVTRSSDPDDRRRVIVDITPAARELLDKVLPEAQQICKLAMAELTDEQMLQLRDTVAVVRQGLNELPDPIPAPKPRRTPKHLRRS
jgi:DNA-binding MarR family transcriptional regulator